MDLNNFQLIRLSSDHNLKPFDCEDSDLNDFLINDSLRHQDELLAVTYVIENDSETVAFFSLFNDKVTHEDFESKNQWKIRIKKLMPIGKQYNSYPAMKIGRLGVNIKYQKNGIGGIIIDYLKQLFIQNNRTGCKFITVDAYSKSLGFYEKKGFEYFTKNDNAEDTRQMYFDLIKII
jgi:hypothetical protein